MNTKMKLLLWRVKNYPFVSIGIVVINFIVFLLCMIFPQIYEKGYNGIYQVLLQKEYGRVVWSTFLHSDAGHIFNNMIINHLFIFSFYGFSCISSILLDDYFILKDTGRVPYERTNLLAAENYVFKLCGSLYGSRGW